MQTLLKRIFPGQQDTNQQNDSDLRGFDLADALEVGDMREVIADWSQPSKETGTYVMRKVAEANEWAVWDFRTMTFIMRAIVSFEEDGTFTSLFDMREVAASGRRGRVRVAIYLYKQGDTGSNASNPTVIMFSDASRTDWKALKVHCESCRYKHRRSSFTEGDESPRTGNSDSPVGSSRFDSSSACSYMSPMDEKDYVDICSIVPSSQEILRMSHWPMQIHDCPFTKLNVSLPTRPGEWCSMSVSRPSLADRTNLTASSNGPAQFESKLPIWSESLKALALEFRQRAVLPSRRNFQLAQKGGEMVFQFFRSNKNEFTLELRQGDSPATSTVSLIQAFCIALSSTLWH